MILDKDQYRRNIVQIADLFEHSFRRKLNPKFLRWRYLDNPADDLLVCIESEADVIIANYSASPCSLLVDRQPLKTALSMTTMTHPDFAGRGLFTKLAKDLYEEMAGREYSMVWGFPNNQSHRGFVTRLGWRDIYEIPTMRLELADKARTGKSDPRILEDSEFGLNYDCLQSNNNFICVKKDSAYLKWRYRDNPLNKYVNFVIAANGVVSSCCVVKAYGESLDIVDFQANDPAEAEALLVNAVGHAGDRKLKAINCWAPRHHFLHNLYEKYGFTNKEPITYLGAASFDSKTADVNNYDLWYIQMGDSDVY